MTIFADRMAMRHEAKKAHVEVGSSERVSRALLRRAAPRVGEYGLGDLVQFQLAEKKKETNRRKRLSPAARVIGFEGKKIAWAIFEGCQTKLL